MDHGYFRDRISGYLDGELPEYEMEAVRQHLAACPECRAALEELRKVDLLVERHSGLDGEEYWEAQARKIEQRIGIEGAERVIDVSGGRRWFKWKLAAVAASAAVLIFVAVNQTNILRQESPGETPMQTTPKDEPAEQPTQSPAVEPDKTAHDAIAVKDKPVPTVADVEKAGGEADEYKAAAKTEDELQPPAPQSHEMAKSIVADDRLAPAEVPEIREVEIAPEIANIADEEPEATVAEELARIAPLAKAYDYDEAAPAPSATALMPPISLAGKAEYASFQALSPAARIVAGTLSAPVEDERLSLSDWERHRDSLQDRWEDLTAAERKLAMSGTRRARGEFTDVSMVERQLIEAQFTVGRLAEREHPEARREAIEFLEDYMARPDARYRSTARMYLEQLQPEPTTND